MSGTIGVGTPATTTARGVGRLATTADLAEGATINHGPALIDVNALKSISTQYAACATASATAAKSADLQDFALRSGARVYVTFTNPNTVAGALTLNVNDTGDVPIYNEFGVVSTTNPAFFPANQPIEFVYDTARNCWMYRYADVVRPVPGGTVITVATPANGANTPAAPADGEYSLYATTSSSDISLGLARIIGGATDAWVGTKVIPGILPPGVSMRVAKGDILRVVYAAGADMHLRFIYDKGAI